MAKFKLVSPYKPAGSQPAAIEALTKNLGNASTLMGVTGSGKTFTIANVIANQNKPVIILSPNKTLAAQLYEEFSLFFPHNKVCYFVSYYDYYQPESYLPAQDIYIPKETKINQEIERLRIEATASLVNRNDTIVIASVSCIYSLGNPWDYRNLAFGLQVGQNISRKELLQRLIFIQYVRNDIERKSGTIQVLGNTVEVILPYQKEKLRIEFFGDTIEGLQWVHPVTNSVLADLDNVLIFPAKHFVTTQEKKDAALASIKNELDHYLPTMKNPLYQDRLDKRVRNDLEMIKEVGFCSGIENYTIHFDGRQPGQAPYTLFDFLGDDFLVVIDESHIAIPQFKGMYAGDRSRKEALVEFGFRLPSAYDNRPLKFEETERFLKNVIYVSATPSEYELKHSTQVVEQIIRPTGLIDPVIELHPRQDQVPHLLDQIQQTISKGYRTLITVMTKRMAEEMAQYMEERKIKVCYLHSEIKTPERTEILQKLRLGIFDVLVGVNLLREGLDLPEVALVAIMDADIESFLRDKRSLIQTIGRAARNNEAKVIMYADKVTGSMHAAIAETERRRELQLAYNKEHNIVPRTVIREVSESILPKGKLEKIKKGKGKKGAKTTVAPIHADATHVRILELERQMQKAAAEFNFELAISLREQWQQLKDQLDEGENTPVK